MLLLRGNTFFIRLSDEQFRTNFFYWYIWLDLQRIFDLLLLWLHDLDSEHRASTGRNSFGTRGRKINFGLFRVVLLFIDDCILIRGNICRTFEEGCLQWLLISHKFARKHLSTSNLTVHWLWCRSFNHLLTTYAACTITVSNLLISISEFLFRLYLSIFALISKLVLIGKAFVRIEPLPSVLHVWLWSLSCIFDFVLLETEGLQNLGSQLHSILLNICVHAARHGWKYAFGNTFWRYLPNLRGQLNVLSWVLMCNQGVVNWLDILLLELLAYLELFFWSILIRRSNFLLCDFLI